MQSVRPLEPLAEFISVRKPAEAQAHQQLHSDYQQRLRTTETRDAGPALHLGVRRVGPTWHGPLLPPEQTNYVLAGHEVVTPSNLCSSQGRIHPRSYLRLCSHFRSQPLRASLVLGSQRIGATRTWRLLQALTCDQVSTAKSSSVRSCENFCRKRARARSDQVW